MKKIVLLAFLFLGFCSYSFSNVSFEKVKKYSDYNHVVIDTIFVTGIVERSCIDGTGSIQLFGNRGTPPYLYSLDGITYTNSSKYVGLSPGLYRVWVKDANGLLNSSSIYTIDPPLTADFTSNNLTITVTASGGSIPYQYSFNNGVTYSSTNSFVFPVPGNYACIVRDAYGCIINKSVSTDVNAPLINGKDTATIPYVAGSKLSDIVIEGAQNIKWYDNPGITLLAKLKQAYRLSAVIPLDPNTIVEDGKTYYASQTINGYESLRRSAVTVSSTLGSEDFTLSDFNYYPNPVQNILSVSNATTIDEVTITSVLGNTNMTKKINSTNSDIDMSNVPSGIYFLKVKSAGKEKTVKILK